MKLLKIIQAYLAVAATNFLISLVTGCTLLIITSVLDMAFAIYLEYRVIKRLNRNRTEKDKVKGLTIFTE